MTRNGRNFPVLYIDEYGVISALTQEAAAVCLHMSNKVDPLHRLRSQQQGLAYYVIFLEIFGR